jgi:NTP pyrophosphatase (non-canonical NTP hydrolase)
LKQANAGIRRIDDCKENLGHEQSDCLRLIIILADKCGFDLEVEIERNASELVQYVYDEPGT